MGTVVTIDGYEVRTPEVAFDFTMRTTSVMEHSRGIAWTADLFLGPVRIGTVEQMGEGGADVVRIPEAGHRTVWNLACAAAFPNPNLSAEEDATFWLMIAESL